MGKTGKPRRSDQLDGNKEGQRGFLFLRGPPSRFSRELGAELARLGHHVRRVNVCTGDWIYWHDKRAVNYRGDADGWESYLKNLIQKEGITDIIYYADRLPYHIIAQKVARQLGVRAISFEFGYLRPDWIIVERGGQSTYSHFPDDLETIRNLSKGLDDADLNNRYPFRFSTEALNETLWEMTNYFLWFLYPRFDTDLLYNPLVESLSYIPRFTKGRLRRNRARNIIQRLTTSDRPYFVVPLQMQNDYQIRKNSTYTHLEQFIREVMRSFHAHADKNAVLVFKKHPLDNGLENWMRVLKRLTEKHNLANRVIFIDGGNLMTLLQSAKGAVLINSTTGLHALQQGCPVKTTGIAVYDIDGLTHQGPLDTFWQNPQKPHPSDVQALVNLLAEGIHVKGNFYSRKGRKAAIAAFVSRLVDHRVNAHATFVNPPPRLAKARDLCISVEY